MNSFFNKKWFKFLRDIVIYALLAYVFLPVSVHSFRAYFQCRVQCSALRIVNSPWLYHGRKVTVVGFLKIQFEENTLYPFAESAKYHPLAESIWVDVTDDIRLRRNELNLSYVKITGTFNAMRHGHGNLFIGTIENIEKVSLVYARPVYP